MSDQDSKDKAEGQDRFEFQAEVSRLLHLMVHSVYTEREIFLRELISNASDACDKLRYAAITEPELLGEDPDLKITISTDKEKRTLTIGDNGIGMDRRELIDNLGTIARSGTRAFLEQAANADDQTALIGQFGVGFYSAFMVAEHIDVISRRAGEEETFVWQSDGSGSFSISEYENQEDGVSSRGTIIRIRLNKDSEQFLDEAEISRIVHQYSDHISFPIVFIPATGDKDGEGEKSEPKALNSASALWTRSKSEISEDEYLSFYRHVAIAFDEPSRIIHYRAEGRNEYSVLLFVPTMKPFDLFDPSRTGKVRLYVKRVFITDDADLLPSYLRFIRGVIDSQDMPLNISREMLQNNPIVAAIRKAVTGRVLSELSKFAAEDKEAYEKFWEAFGPCIKEGLYEDAERRDAIYELTRFRSTKGEELRSLKDYVSDMVENQTTIYYLVGENLSQLNASPQLEGFKHRNLEVLLLSDPVDNFWVTTALGYDGKPFQSITQGETDLTKFPTIGEDEKQEQTAEEASASADLVKALRNEYGSTVSDVKLSTRLINSPACLVAPAGGPDRGLDKILSQRDQGREQAPIIEINTRHSLVRMLSSWMSSGKHEEFKDLAWILLDEARILEGALPEDPAKFSDRLNRLVSRAVEGESLSNQPE